MYFLISSSSLYLLQPYFTEPIEDVMYSNIKNQIHLNIHPTKWSNYHIQTWCQFHLLYHSSHRGPRKQAFTLLQLGNESDHPLCISEICYRHFKPLAVVGSCQTGILEWSNPRDDWTNTVAVWYIRKHWQPICQGIGGLVTARKTPRNA